MNHSQRLYKTCVLVNNNLCEKLFSSLELPAKFDKTFKVTKISFLVQFLNY